MGEPPVINKHLAPISINVSESCDFVTSVSGTEPITAKWLKDNQLLPSSTHFVQTYSNGEARLRIEEANLEDAALYSVEISNEWGKMYSCATLTVKGEFACSCLLGKRARRRRERERGRSQG